MKINNLWLKASVLFIITMSLTACATKSSVRPQNQNVNMLLGQWDGVLMAVSSSAIGGRSVSLIIKEVDTESKKVRGTYVGHYLPHVRSVSLANGWQTDFEGTLTEENGLEIICVLETGTKLEIKLEDGKLAGKSFGRGYGSDTIRHEMSLVKRE